MREMKCKKRVFRAKAVADCVVQAHGREGGVKTHEESVREVRQPYFVASKWKEKSGETWQWRSGGGPARKTEKM